jgi:YgiT-type zinc finger domain-containing protein
MAQRLEDSDPMRKLFDHCPVCSGSLEVELVEQTVRGNGSTATLTVEASVCQRCGERLYEPETVKLFDRIRAQLKDNQTDTLIRTGTSYRVA